MTCDVSLQGTTGIQNPTALTRRRRHLFARLAARALEPAKGVGWALASNAEERYQDRCRA